MLKKDAYYFSHDSNAKDDFKCMLLIEEIGLEGYGIFWILVETLREQESYKYPLKLLPSLARKYNTTLAKMRVVVLNYGLFILEDEKFFFSKSLNNRMALMNSKKEQARLAGIKSGEARRLKNEQKSNGRSTDVQQMLNKERKEKEKKEKEKKDIEILRKISGMTAREMSQIKLESLGLSIECENLVKKESLPMIVNYAINNTRYLIGEIKKGY
ncbi:DUF4373 domain-containing protein [Poseidonibacter lekithochrous]|uniref:Lin1244/Lin1753 domain-containing protein n=1 Tax=Poseidonibacter TaxID=2321187 RepID=UPI001C09F76E|nr:MULTISPECIES: Lin1244/Lin1753 domain-containing protein [Poseidonibacter]MBU3014347.1 DUF4373 domain-containing protein [Poseidonibacter lekithochrous]MDO6827645.1 DUF4373 domain-containing protein [Poseidonibacter sp. 1_MG-2023]